MPAVRYQPPKADEIVLERHEGRLEARGREEAPGSGLRVRWPPPGARRRGSTLLRAIGDARCVIDATAGLGVDAWTLACAGRRVVAIERSVVLARLLQEAIHEARRAWPEEAARLSIMHADSRGALAGVVAELSGRTGSAPAVLLDPMFPPKRRASALPSKQMQFLASLVGDDPDAPELFHAAMRSGAARVVVKRPPHAAPMAPAVAFSLESKLVRFDVHLPPTARRTRKEQG